MKRIKYLASILTFNFLFFANSFDINAQDQVRIGNQIWMTQNLNVSTFRNGDTIPEAKTIKEWRFYNSKNQPAWCYYNNDSTNAYFGKLYNWSAVADPRELAPEGWHIPSGDEWHVLHSFLSVNGKEGKKLKSDSLWTKDGNGTNATGFNALPSGIREIDLMFKPKECFRWMGSLAVWWSRTLPKPKHYDLIECFVIRVDDKATFEWQNEMNGYAVRCVKD